MWKKKKKYEIQVKELQKEMDELSISQPRRASEVHQSMLTSLLDAEGDFTNAKKEWDRKDHEQKNENKKITRRVGENERKSR